MHQFVNRFNSSRVPRTDLNEKKLGQMSQEHSCTSYMSLCNLPALIYQLKKQIRKFILQHYQTVQLPSYCNISEKRMATLRHSGRITDFFILLMCQVVNSGTTRTIVVLLFQSQAVLRLLDILELNLH
jgi:hypothetical protein